MARTTPEQLPKPQWMTLDQAAAYLAVDRVTLRRRIADGTLPAFKLKRQIRVRVSDVEKILTPVPTGGWRA